MPELDRKATSVFAGKVVRKDLVRKVKVGANVPVFVLEYLLGKYCATDDPVAIAPDLRVPVESDVIRALGHVALIAGELHDGAGGHGVRRACEGTPLLFALA